MNQFSSRFLVQEIFISLMFFTIFLDGFLETHFFLMQIPVAIRDLVLAGILIFYIFKKNVDYFEKLTIVFGNATLLLLDYFGIVCAHNALCFRETRFPIYHWIFIPSFILYLQRISNAWTFRGGVTVSKKFQVFVYLPMLLSIFLWFLFQIFKVSILLFTFLAVTLSLFIYGIFWRANKRQSG